DQRGEEIQDFVLSCGCVGVWECGCGAGRARRFGVRTPIHPHTLTHTHRLRCLQRPPTGEDGETAEQDFLRLTEEVVAPVDQRSQGLLPRRGGPATLREEREPVV